MIPMLSGAWRQGKEKAVKHTDYAVWWSALPIKTQASHSG